MTARRPSRRRPGHRRTRRGRDRARDCRDGSNRRSARVGGTRRPRCRCRRACVVPPSPRRRERRRGGVGYFLAKHLLPEESESTHARVQTRIRHRRPGNVDRSDHATDDLDLALEASDAQRSATAASSRYSSSVNRKEAACTFSSRCSIEDVPGIGSITGDRFNSQASATCLGVLP
jgi:hypothetical protein